MSYNYRRNNSDSRRAMNELKNALWTIRNNVERLTDRIKKYDDDVSYSFGGLFGDTDKYREKLNKCSKLLEEYLDIILRAIKLNSRYLPKGQIKHLCDIYTVDQCVYRIRFCSANNIDTINSLWRDISNRLGII